MPSASFSVAIASSLSWKRKAASSIATRSAGASCALSGDSLRSSLSLLSCSFCSRSGLIVSRSQPASSVIWLDGAEARAHHLGLVAELLVVRVDAAHRLHARIVRAAVLGLVPVGAGLLLVPVVDAPDERRDQLRAGFGAGGGLHEREQQGHVALDAFLLQHLGGADSFPGRGELDQHALAADAGGFVQVDQFAALVDRALGVERQARVDLGRDAARDDLEDFGAEGDQQAVDDDVGRFAGVIAHGFLEQRLVRILLDGLQDQRRIGGRVLRLVLRELLEIARIGDDGGVLLQLVECGSHERIDGGRKAPGSTEGRATAARRRSGPADPPASGAGNGDRKALF